MSVLCKTVTALAPEHTKCTTSCLGCKPCSSVPLVTALWCAGMAALLRSLRGTPQPGRERTEGELWHSVDLWAVWRRWTGTAQSFPEETFPPTHKLGSRVVQQVKESPGAISLPNTYLNSGTCCRTLKSYLGLKMNGNKFPSRALKQNDNTSGSFCSVNSMWCWQ